MADPLRLDRRDVLRGLAIVTGAAVTAGAAYRAGAASAAPTFQPVTAAACAESSFGLIQTTGGNLGPTVVVNEL